jgi:hypothetical protein
MADRREPGLRSPRWLNALIWSTGLGAAACFVWQMLTSEGEPTCMPVGVVTIASRVLGFALLPVVMVGTALSRGMKRVAQ